MCLKIKILQTFDLKLNKWGPASIFKQLDVVDRGSETQHQVVENVNKLTG